MTVVAEPTVDVAIRGRCGTTRPVRAGEIGEPRRIVIAPDVVPAPARPAVAPTPASPELPSPAPAVPEAEPVGRRRWGMVGRHSGG